MFRGVFGARESGVELFADAVDRAPVVGSHGVPESGTYPLVGGGFAGAGSDVVREIGLFQRPDVHVGKDLD